VAYNHKILILKAANFRKNDSMCVEVFMLLVLSLLNGNRTLHGREMGTCSN